ncbi:MAG: hypothetical protein KKD44_00855 [Proteobacteria bacterium]|nr:hypothetical protein [Pseudomonadota bacterium]
MKSYFFVGYLIMGAILIHRPPCACAFEIHGQYASVSYETENMLEAFNNRLFMGRLRYLLRAKRALTMEDEVISKMDVISKKVEQVLEMFPPHLHYSVSLCENMDRVKDKFIALHRLEWKRPGFYSPINDTMYLSVKNANLQVVAHEVGHVVVEKYFKVRPPVKVHELLAQYAEKHIGD